eukprot:7375872-Pyramimonas_sp.AAC.1
MYIGSMRDGLMLDTRKYGTMHSTSWTRCACEAYVRKHRMHETYVYEAYGTRHCISICPLGGRSLAAFRASTERPNSC